VAISKYHPNEYIEAAYEEGQRVFGESHEQELRLKHETLPKDIEWHFIGHLQTNKVKYIAPYVTMIEAVDSLKLLKEIDKQAAKCGRVHRCVTGTTYCRRKYKIRSEGLMIAANYWPVESGNS
jgi:Predicted enzyme with a TIM-barrel fold